MSKEKARAGLLVVLAFVLGCSVKAQVTAVDPLSLPLNGPMLCRSIVDPEGVLLEFTDAGRSFGKRESTLGFDTAGTPIQVAVSAEAKSADGKPVMHIVVVRFIPRAEGAHTVVKGFDPNFEMPLRRLDDNVENLPAGWSKATQKEIDQARSMAVDFWKRRCGKDSEPRAGTLLPPTTD